MKTVRGRGLEGRGVEGVRSGRMKCRWEQGVVRIAH